LKRVLVLGAGQSSPFLVARLLEMAPELDWSVTVADSDRAAAERAVGRHERGRAEGFDVNDSSARSGLIAEADVVVHMLPPAFLGLVAWDCVAQGKHLLSVSYRDQGIRDLDADARKKGLLLLSELGLDPGIDHMSAMNVIQRVRDAGGRITSFCSYGSGIPAPDQPQNPLRYVITWNPRNVVMAGENGAQYMEDGRIKIVPYHHVFHRTWRVDVPGVGTLEAYPNRDSLSYMTSFGLEDVRTMIRGTLRYPGWCETWNHVVRLGLPNEKLRIPDLAERTYADVVQMLLPLNPSGEPLASRAARYLGISPTGRIMENLEWLGLFSDEKTGCPGETSAAMLTHRLQQKLPLLPGQRDLVVLLHDLEVEYPSGDRPGERIVSTLVAEGDPAGEEGGFTAMSKTVGLPVAVAVKLLLTGDLTLTGSHIPTHPSIYVPELRELARDGLEFRETITPREPVT
jgi:saccharopine dehydrogenase-like NADP-dependent oxidoreductase